MNRQQRRLMAKRKETEAKYYKDLESAQLQKNDAQLNFFTAAIIMAHHKYYGPNRDGDIEGFMREWNDEVIRVSGGTPDDYLRYLREIKKKTGYAFEITDRGDT